MEDYLKHLELLNFRKEQRKEKKIQPNESKQDLKYSDINWDYIGRSGEIFNQLSVKQLSTYVNKHNFAVKDYKLKKERKG